MTSLMSSITVIALLGVFYALMGGLGIISGITMFDFILDVMVINIWYAVMFKSG